MHNENFLRYYCKTCDYRRFHGKSPLQVLFKGTKVASRNTISMKKKPKRVGVHFGYTSEWKKAIVTLTADSKTIEFFDGMM